MSESTIASTFGGEVVEPGVIFFPNNVWLGDIVSVNESGTTWTNVSEQISNALDSIPGNWGCGETMDGTYYHNSDVVGDTWYPGK